MDFKMTIPVWDSYDIIVCGGGIAGCAAALEGARHGKKVMLLEKSTVLGGLATMGLINYFVPMCNGRGIPICKGMAEEFLRLSIRYGYDTLHPAWKVYVISSHPNFEQCYGRPAAKRRRLYNGMIPCQLYMYG